jgi:hypothetical protein
VHHRRVIICKTAFGAPGNEKFHLKNFELGIESVVRFLEEAAG